MQAICQINCQQLQPRGSEREAAGWEGQIEEWEEEEEQKQQDDADLVLDCDLID